MGPAAEIDLQSGPGQAHGEARTPRAGADHRGAADRRQTAEPLPLEHHARPDPVGDRARERRRGILRPAGSAARGRRGSSPCEDGSASFLRIDSVPITATGTTGAPLSSASRPTPRLARPSEPGRTRVPSGKISTMSPRPRIAFAVRDRVLVGVAAVDREGAERVEDPPLPAAHEQLLLGHVVHRPLGHRGDHERIEEAAVVGGDDHRAGRAGCAPARSGSGGSRPGRTAGARPGRASRGPAARPVSRARR